MAASTVEQPKGLARIDDAQQFLKLSRAAIYLLMDRGELAFVKIGRSRRVPWDSLEALVKRNLVQAR